MTNALTREHRLTCLLDVRNALQSGTELSLRDLDDAISRLQKRESIIAVFGAFSAGKSSLLNALLGQSLLTVSPNPTTASVTQIRHAGAEQNVTVTAKTSDELWRDIENTFRDLHHHPSTMEEAMNLIDSLDAKAYPTSLRRHIRFLKAIREGYEDMASRLGTAWETTPEALQTFTADERFAAYVARVDVYAMHQTLARGFVFVDTPGVDSIHRRHTDVAFRYMRHADAVLFVMYYTHAFTQGDRDFLLQLAGVQDVSETNKLFSVINAVDLAKSEEERNAVKARVDMELRRLGIRHPRIFEVSAQLAEAGRRLSNDKSDETAVQMAKARLGRTPNEEWAITDESVRELLVQSGILTLERELEGYVEESGDVLEQQMTVRVLQQLSEQVADQIQIQTRRKTDSREARLARMEVLEKLRQQIEDEQSRWLDSATAPERQQLIRELGELGFHAGERIRLRYRDLIRATYHPSRFRIGRTADKLREASEELMAALARQVDIETRTFSLRAEALQARIVTQMTELWNRRLVDASAGHLEQALSSESGIVVDSVQAALSQQTIQSYHRLFSSPKQFFEEGGQRDLMEASEGPVMEDVKSELNRLLEQIQTRACDVLANRCKALLERAETAITTAIADTDVPFDASKLDSYEHFDKLLQEARLTCSSPS